MTNKGKTPIQDLGCANNLQKCDETLVLSMCWDDSICAAVKNLFKDTSQDTFGRLTGPLWFVSIDSNDDLDLTRKLVSDLIILDHHFISKNGLAVIHKHHPDAELIKIMPIWGESPGKEQFLQWTINFSDMDNGVEFCFKEPVEPELLQHAINYLLLRYMNNIQVKNALEAAAAHRYLNVKN